MINAILDFARSRRRTLALVVMGLLLRPFQGQSNPAGMQVVRGSAQAVQNGSQLNITASHNAFLNWSSFNIGRGETTVFQQPSASSIVWNRIGGANPSQIYGNLQANGVVVLANQSGFYFGPGSFVQAAGLYITTAPISPAMSTGGSFEFSGAPPSIPIVNYGMIETTGGGPLFLIAKQIENHGTLSAPAGTVGLTAAEDVMISDRPDGRGLSVRVRMPQGTVDNSGSIRADAGRVLMHAQTVNQGGLVQANSVRERNGVIEIFASDKIELAAQSVIQAKGDDQEPSLGGRVTIKSDQVYVDHAGSVISAAGGARGGDGGRMEISALAMSGIASLIDALAVTGWRSGGLFIDPTDIVLSNSGSGSAGGGTVGPNDPPTTLLLNVNTAFTGFSQITLQATRNITLQSGTSWNLPASTGKDDAGCLLTLQAGNDILFNTGSLLSGGNNWSVSLLAGANFNSGVGAISGVGNISLLGTATIQTGLGNINATAGKNVTVATGAIRTVGGGNIDVEAVAGNVDSGTNPNGFNFAKTGVGYVVSPTLGGISTADGGNVHLKAGANISSFLPPRSGNGSASEAGSGAFGAAPGDVILEAGGNISGHYVLRNGIGRIASGGDAGTTSRGLALSLIKGGWFVDAGGSIVLQEVRNPNGIFNSSSLNNPFNFRFDYDPASAVHLKAGDGVLIAGNSLPRASGGGQGLIFPPTLSIEAGAGGISLGADLTLFPSPVGSLDVHTLGGGNLQSTLAGTPRYIVVSDSDKIRWTGPTDFTSVDRGQNTLHLNDPVPVNVNVSGSVSDFNLVSSKPVTMVVTKDILNSSVLAQNFRATDQTSITAGGRIANRNFYSFVTLEPNSPAPDFLLLLRAVLQTPEPVFPPLLDQSIAALASLFTYNPTTRTLGFAGRMSKAVRDSLLSLKVINLDNPDGPPISGTFVDAVTLERLYQASLDVPIVPIQGFEISGPGRLTLAANSMDLGVSRGIVSHGISVNPALAPYTSRGADIDITLAGDFDMFSSLVLSEYGGNIGIKAGGSISVGSRDRLVGSDLPRGIISLWAGNIDVEAGGNLEVNGSRIAAYDGGNIHLKSLTGNVDAGGGGSGFVRVSKPYLDPKTGQLRFAGATIPGSGVLATSFPENVPGQRPRIGNILVETPQGNIVAGAGGFVQLDLHGGASKEAGITLDAGTKNPDGTVKYVGSILATGSGVIGNKVDLKATGDIKGLIVAQGDLSISAQQNVSVTAIGQGAVSVKSDSGNVSGTIVGVGAVNVSGANINANVVAGPGSASVSGNVTGTGTQAAAPVASTASQTDAKKVEEVAANSTAANQDDDETKRSRPVLTKKRVGRVTVILPKS